MDFSPTKLGRVTPGTSYTGGDDVFATDLTPTFDGTVRVEYAVSAAVVPQVRHNGVTLVLNSGDAAVADGIEAYEFTCTKDETFNLRFSGSVTIRRCTVRGYALR